ncbi:MAG: phosphatase PAP2 family protein [Bacteroides sp.]
MALNLFKKIEMQKGLFAVEKIGLIYNLLTSILIVFMFSRMAHPLELLWERALIAGITFAGIYLYRLAPSKFSACVRMLFQMALLAYWYPDTFELNRFLPNLDHLFATTEAFLFGCQPAIEFCARFSDKWISEAFNLGYFSYYPMMGIVFFYYFLYRFELFEKTSFVLAASFFIYYLIYVFIPVAGPQYYFPAIGLENVSIAHFPSIGEYFNFHQELLPAPGGHDGFFYNLVESSQKAGERPTAAFPSSHVGISTILMIMAFRGNKILFSCLIPFYFLLCCSTVYIQAHYLIDAIAGVVSAILIYYLTTWMYKKWFRSPMFSLGDSPQ